MADVTITATSVVTALTATPSYEDLVAGATITAGQVCYKDSTDQNKAKLADGNASVLIAEAKGIALHGAASGQPVKLQTGGDINIGGTVTVGGVYVLSATPGGIAPVADLASGNFTMIVGIGKTANVLHLIMRTAGVAVP